MIICDFRISTIKGMDMFSMFGNLMLATDVRISLELQIGALHFFFYSHLDLRQPKAHNFQITWYSLSLSFIYIYKIPLFMCMERGFVDTIWYLKVTCVWHELLATWHLDPSISPTPLSRSYGKPPNPILISIIMFMAINTPKKDHTTCPRHFQSMAIYGHFLG